MPDSNRPELMHLEPRCGEHISFTADRAIALSKKHNRKVRFSFNGVRLTVNKRLSTQHIERTYGHAMWSKHVAFGNLAAGAAERETCRQQIEAAQSTIDRLLSQLPPNQLATPAWLAEYIPASDRIGVDRRLSEVYGILTGLGFISNQHVGAEEFKTNTASFEMRIQYIAGQAISMILGSFNSIHPMIGQWAADLTEEINLESKT